jgi:S1-C subfamily serine protease
VPRPEDQFADIDDDSAPTERLSAPRKARPAAPGMNPKLLYGLIGSGIGVVLLAVLVIFLVGSKPKAVAKNPPPEEPVVPVKRDSVPTKADPPLLKPQLPPVAQWEQDLAVAQKQAAADGKDLLLFFDESDAVVDGRSVTDEVFNQADFRNKGAFRYVPVHIDFPREPANRKKVQNAARNQETLRRYGIPQDALPIIIMADEKGRPFGAVRYELANAGVDRFMTQLGNLGNVKQIIEQMFLNIERNEGTQKILAMKNALATLSRTGLLQFYGDELSGWAKSAEELDPTNRSGLKEEIFELVWVGSTRGTRDKTLIAKQLERLETWKGPNRFRNQDRGARIFFIASQVCNQTGDAERAQALLKEAQTYQPTDKELAAMLNTGNLTLFASTGTGFVVSPEGYVMTNYHVVDEGKPFVRFEGKDLPAAVVAFDAKRDMAIVKFQPPAGTVLKPIRPCGERMMGRGEKIAVLGFPLASSVGTGLKLTQGIVTGLPEQVNENMLVTDAKVNPGNSGGPMLDAAGNVIAMVTAKVGRRQGDDLGLAIPSNVLDEFLKAKIKGYQPPPRLDKSMELPELDKYASPSVLLVLTKSDDR